MGYSDSNSVIKVTAVAISSFPALVLSASWRGELKLYNIKVRL